jgi:nicotinamidase-related amidase
MYKVLVVIDMQIDFISGGFRIPAAEALVEPILERIKQGQEPPSELLLFTKDTHGTNYLQTAEGKKLPIVHGVKGTQGWELHPRIAPYALPQYTFEKPTFGSILLMEFLKSRESEIIEIELAGLCTDICIISNALIIRAALPETKILLNPNLCTGTTPENHEKALSILQACHIDLIT